MMEIHRVQHITVQHSIARVRMQFPQFEMSMADGSRNPAPPPSARFSDQAATSRGWRGAKSMSAATAVVGLPRLTRLLRPWLRLQDRRSENPSTDLVHNLSAAGHDSWESGRR
jgi:hypothetical protein